MQTQPPAPKTEVLIVGAGPVGLTLAAELARYGVSVRIVEKASRASDTSRAIVIWSRTLELMDRMGCTPAFLEAGHKATAANILADGKTIGHVSLEDIVSPHPYALMLPQSDTERLMADHLLRFGVRVERGVAFERFETMENGIVSHLRRADGMVESLGSAWLVGCDGAHSAVRHQLGKEFVGDTLETNWVLADVRLEGADSESAVEINWSAAGILALFPISPGRFRIIADIGPSEPGTTLRDPTLADIQDVLERRGRPGLKASSPIWMANFHINERKVEDYRDGCVFLAGDAAHIHSPAGGQGMNMGMQDACNLAWKLALVCKGHCSQEPLLGSFSAERSEIGRQVLKATGRITRLALIRAGVARAIRDHVASLILGVHAAQRKMAETLSEISMGYPESPLNSKAERPPEGPAPGERAPIRAGETPVGSGATPLFALFAAPGPEAAGLVREFPSLMEPALRAPFAAGGLCLVRPDGYVAVAARTGSEPDIARFLRSLAI